MRQTNTLISFSMLTEINRYEQRVLLSLPPSHYLLCAPPKPEKKASLKKKKNMTQISSSE